MRTFRYNRRKCQSDNALRYTGAVGVGDNNGIAVCRLQNVPTHHCADVLFKVKRKEGEPHIASAIVVDVDYGMQE